LTYKGTNGSSELSDDLSGNIFNTTGGVWGNVTGTTFGIIIVQDADDSLSKSNPTINAGDIAYLVVDLSKTQIGTVGARKEITIEVRPEFGAPGFSKVVTPPSFGGSGYEIVDLK